MNPLDREQAIERAKEYYYLFKSYMVDIDTTDGDGITRTYPGYLTEDWVKFLARTFVSEIIRIKEKDSWMGAGYHNDPRHWREVLAQIDKL